MTAPSLFEQTPVYEAFSRPGPAALGAFHPANTFRTPFYRDRRKVTAYQRAVRRIPAAAGSTPGSGVNFDLTAGNLAAGGLLDVKIAIVAHAVAAAAPVRRKIDAASLLVTGGLSAAVASASVTWRAPPGIDVAPVEVQHISNLCVSMPVVAATVEAVTGRREGLCDVFPADGAVSPPWFFKTAPNKLFFVDELGTAGAALSFSVHANGACCAAAALVRAAAPGVEFSEDAPDGGDGDASQRCCDAWRYVCAFAEVAELMEVDQTAITAAPRLAPVPSVSRAGFVVAITPPSLSPSIEVPGIFAGVLVQSAASATLTVSHEGGVVVDHVPLGLLPSVGDGWRLWTTTVSPREAPSVPPPGPMLTALHAQKRAAAPGITAAVSGDGAAVCAAVYVRAVEFGREGAQFIFDT